LEGDIFLNDYGRGNLELALVIQESRPNGEEHLCSLSAAKRRNTSSG